MTGLRPYDFGRLFKQSISQSVYDMRALLKQRPDTEHELTANRLLLSSTFLIYLVISHMMGSDAATTALQIAAVPALAFEAIAGALFLHLLVSPGVSHVRRLIGIVADLGLFSFGVHISGEAGAAFILVYFWAVLGNGFRFGLTYLAIAAVTALVCFGVVYANTPFWQSQPSVSIGLAAALIVIPAYTSKLIRKLSEAKQQAEEASRSKSLFLASMSHELRTPLNAIIGLADLLVSARLKTEQHEMARVIGASGRSLLSLIETVLDFARIESGQMTIKSEPIELSALLRDVRAMIGVSASKKGLRVAIHIRPGAPRAVVADRRHLEEVILNLASNAVKFTEHGYVRLEVGFRSETDERGDLLVDVADTGIGIDPSAHGRIFERFTQADGSIMDRFGGTGLGLAIVRQLVRTMGGEISVSSALGRGSVFSFHLPVEVAELEAPHASEAAPILISQRHHDGALIAGLSPVTSLEAAIARIRSLQANGISRPAVLIDAALTDPTAVEVAHALLQPGTGEDEPVLVLLVDPVSPVPDFDRNLFVAVTNGSDMELAKHLAGLSGAPLIVDDQPAATAGYRILIADDNKTNQMVIAKTLESGGHSFEIADNGEDAVDLMLKGGFDLVLMDVNMPVMNGIEATKFYRFASLGTVAIPIVGFTADATGEARQRCLDAGMMECLTKPIEPKRLIAEIDRLLDGAIPVARESSEETGTDADSPSASEQPVIDSGTTAALAQLGGDEFVDALLTQFVDDSANAMKALANAVAEENVGEFRNSAHALRSAAANVGAMRIYQMCLDWREIADRELSESGEIHVHELHEEIDRFRQELDSRKRRAS
ncbi:ATP-binding protein [Rhizobium rhizoryzae]|uniref:ATP-binding protein n=1 Tax=Rhizobium rhizoryzae TaxID=451876 RepID=UPI00289B13A2|nr:ATP-binding protein [Rhizobium rhizoryzae]